MLMEYSGAKHCGRCRQPKIVKTGCFPQNRPQLGGSYSYLYDISVYLPLFVSSLIFDNRYGITVKYIELAYYIKRRP